MVNFFRRVWLWFARIDSRKCDSCNGTFDRTKLDPCSGDWWMCWDCMNAYLKSDSAEGKK